MSKKIIGFSLIEVLISLFIFSLILLGFDAMEINALHESRSAYYSSVADIQIQYMAEKLRAIGDVSTCLESWNQQNKALLPHGEGDVSGSYPGFTVKLHWRDHLEDQLMSEQVFI